MSKLATITGVAITPGVSKNGRLYTHQNIGRLVERANSRIRDGASPITMRTHHAAGDDSTRIVGRVTRIWQDETGAARYEGDIAGSAHGATIADLLPESVDDTSAALRGVSIRGRWASPPKRTTTETGQDVETADDLEMDGLDFTANPGVAGAHAVIAAREVPNVAPLPPNSGVTGESTGDLGIFEAAPDAVITETVAPATRATVPFADPGNYLPDGQRRFPLDTRESAKKAWFALRETDTARTYTAAQLKRVRGRTSKALTEFGVYPDPSEGWLIDAPVPVTEDAGGFGGAYRVCLTNGPTEVTVCCWQLDPHDLDAVGRAAMAGALSAIKAIDPDLDADIDVGSASAETARPAPDELAETADAPPAPEPTPAVVPETTDTPSKDEDSPVADAPITPTDPAAAPAAAPTADGAPAEPDKLDRLAAMMERLVGALTPAAPTAVAAEAAPAAPVAETTTVVPAAVVESEDARIARLVEERVTARIQDLVESGNGPARRGLTATAPGADPQAEAAGLNEHGLPENWPNKPLHEYSDAEFSRHAFPALENYVLRARVPRD